LRAPAERVAVPRPRIVGAMRTRATTASGAIENASSALWCPWKRSTDENITMPRTTSANTFRSVWDTSVPRTTGRLSRGRPLRRATRPFEGWTLDFIHDRLFGGRAPGIGKEFEVPAGRDR